MMVSFTIDTTGPVTDIKVDNADKVHPELAKEACA
jgi:hypothetical protein